MFFLQISKEQLQKIEAADSISKAKWDEKVHAMLDMTPNEIIGSVIKGAIDVALKILLALIVYYIGRWIIRRIKRIINRIFERRKIDLSLRTFLNNVVSISLTIILIIIIVDILGFNTTGLIAIFASAGLAVGMALSGTLQNFAGGVMILLLRPYKTGDFIEAQGHEGTVQSIQLFNTIITTSDNKTVIMPNGPLSTNTIKNTTRQPTRRVQWHLPVDYGDDIDVVKASIEKLLDTEPRILKDKARLVALYSFEDSYIIVRIRAWTESGDYWGVYYDMNAKFFSQLPGMGVTFPYPQLDVKIKKEE